MLTIFHVRHHLSYRYASWTCPFLWRPPLPDYRLHALCRRRVALTTLKSPPSPWSAGRPLWRPHIISAIFTHPLYSESNYHVYPPPCIMSLTTCEVMDLALTSRSPPGGGVLWSEGGLWVRWNVLSGPTFVYIVGWYTYTTFGYKMSHLWRTYLTIVVKYTKMRQTHGRGVTSQPSTWLPSKNRWYQENQKGFQPKFLTNFLIFP